MHFLNRSLLPLAALALCAARLSAADAIEIKQHWPAGKKLTQTMKMEQGSTMTIGPTKMDQKVNMTMEMSTAVTKHEDGKQKRLTIKYDRMAMQMDMGGQKMGFDSAKPEDDPQGIGKAAGGIVGKELRMLANDKDEVTGIENFEEFSAAAGGAAGSPFGQMFSKDSLLDMVKQGSLHAMPGKPVKAGDSWPFSYTMKMPQFGSVTIKGTYTLKGVSPHGGVSCAEIALDGTLNIDFSAADKSADAAGPLAALGVKMNGGKMAGTVWFDTALGMARDSDFTQTMEISMKNPAQPDATMTIPMTQHVTLSLTKVEDVK